MKYNNLLVFYKDSDLKEHRQVLAEIKRLFAKYKIKATFGKRSKFSKYLGKDFDLVLSVGGDGTLLRAARIAQDAAIFGINSNVKKSEGVLCSATADDFIKKLKQVIEGNFFVKNFTKSRVFLKNSGKSYDALNEIYFGSANSYITSRYSLSFGANEEEQKSSGVVIATGLGSTAWYRSITKEVFSPELRELRFVVREPYWGRLSGINLKEGRVFGEEKLLLKSKMRDAVVAIDSIKKLPLDNQKEVQVGVSPKSTRLVVLKEDKYGKNS